MSFKKIKLFYKRYEEVFIPLALLFGFLTDILTFRLIEFSTSMVFLMSHLLFAGLNLGAIIYFKNKEPTKSILKNWKLFAPLLVQFSLGNLFSGFLIFYSRSGSFFASWPFLLTIAILLIGNEVARRREFTPVVKIGVYFFAVLAYFNLVLPYLFKNLSTLVFLAGGFLSLLFGYGFLHLLLKVVPEMKEMKRSFLIVFGVVFLLFNLFYFTNLIPPIPLNLRQAGVHHHIESTNGTYRALTEECKSWDRCLFTPLVRHIKNGESIYFYSAVHAPSGMDLELIHEWQKYDEAESRWVKEAEMPFTLRGGRSQGFRWYSYYVTTPGLWRVSVKTTSGQVVGRETFSVRRGDSQRVLKEL